MPSGALIALEAINADRLLSLERFSDFAVYIVTLIERTYFFGWKLSGKQIL